MIAEFLDHAFAFPGLAERQVQKGFQAVFGGNDALHQEPVIGEGKLHLDPRLRMQAQLQQVAGKQDLPVDAQCIHDAPHQGDVAMDAGVVDAFLQRGLVRDAPRHVLVAEPADRVGQPCPRPGPVLHLFAHVADHRILDIGHDLFPGAQFGMMGIDIDDQPVLEVPLFGIAAGPGEDFPRIGLDIDLFTQFPRVIDPGIHRLPPCFLRLKQTCHACVTENA